MDLLAQLPDPATLSLWDKYGLPGLVIAALFTVNILLLRKSDKDRDKLLEAFKEDSKADRAANADNLKNEGIRSDANLGRLYAKIDELRDDVKESRCKYPGYCAYQGHRPPESNAK